MNEKSQDFCKSRSYNKIEWNKFEEKIIIKLELLKFVGNELSN